jgi:hypothetical protein
MKTFLSEMWAFLFRRTGHPVYRRELTGWSYVGVWRGLRRGCLPLLALPILGSVGCCGLMALPSLGSIRVEDLPDIALMLLGGVFVGGEIVKMLAGLIATALTATAISAEVEANTYGLLRLTPIPPRQIVLAKFGAAVRQLRFPVLAVMLTRALALVGGVALLIVTIVMAAGASPSAQTPAPGTTPLAPFPALPKLLSLVPTLATSLLAVASVIIVGLMWLAYYLFQPFLNVMLFAAVGLFGSSLARTRSGGLFAAALLRVGLWMASYIAGQMLSSLAWVGFAMPLLLMPNSFLWLDALATTQPGLLVVGGAGVAGVWLLLIVGVELATTILLLSFTSQRAGRLPFNKQTAG